MRMAQLVSLPTVIDEPGKYRTRKGETVTVESISKGWASGSYEDGTAEKWDVSGRLLPFSESENDIVAVDKRWIITDWAGNRPYPGKVFDTFEDAWEHVRNDHPDEEDWQEFYVVPEDAPDSE